MKILEQDPLVGFCGSKKRYADMIMKYTNIEPAQVKSIHLNDPGLWGYIWNGIINSDRTHMVSFIREWQNTTAQTCFDTMKEISSDENAESHVLGAASLLLIAGTYGGKEIGGFKGKHKNRPNVDGFIPSRETIIKRVQMLDISRKIITSSNTLAQQVPVISCKKGERIVVFIDPPYHVGKNVYKHDFCRTDVINVAKKWFESGADVVVSEATTIPELEEWSCFDISRCGDKGQNRKNSKSKTELLYVRLHD